MMAKQAETCSKIKNLLCKKNILKPYKKTVYFSSSELRHKLHATQFQRTIPVNKDN
jgi:hypothetical protein